MNFNISVEFYTKDQEQWVYISDDSSGANYKVSDTNQVMQLIQDYIETKKSEN